VLRELEVVLLAIYLNVLWEVLDKCHLEPLFAVHAAGGLPKVQ